MFTTVPEQLAGLSLKRLQALATTLQAEIEDALSGDGVTQALLNTIKTEVKPELARLQTAIDEKTPASPEELAAARDELFGSDETDEVDETEEFETEEEVDEEDEVDEADESDLADDDATPPAADHSAPSTYGTPDAGEGEGASGGRFTPQAFLAADGLNGVSAGHAFSDWAELAEALVDKASTLGPNSDGQHTVGVIHGNFAEDRILKGTALDNIQKFNPDEIAAALCAPAQPVYDLACASSTARPVYNSLVTFGNADRGKVSIYPSPTMSDIADNATNDPTGIWTSADDGNPASIKGYTEITCATPVEYEVYGVYRQMKVKNLLARTYPELVEAYLNKLAATWARTGDVQLLNAMAASAVTLTDPGTQLYGADVAILSRLLEYRGMYDDVERWDSTLNHDGWLPRWVLWALKVNSLRRATDTGVPRLATTAEINAQFASAGVDINWVMDRASYMVAYSALNNGGALGRLPNRVDVLVAPKGKYAIMDLGTLEVGVRGAGGNSVVRDNTSNSKNEFNFFFESFEGVVDTNSCPSHIIQVSNLSFNGAQIAPIAMDELGEAVV